MKRLLQMRFIKKIFPILIYQQCAICGYEYRFNWMWRILVGFWRDMPEYQWICCKCISCKDDVRIWLDKYHIERIKKEEKWRANPPQGGSGVPSKKNIRNLVNYESNGKI